MNKHEAELKIAKILAQYESDTGSLVASIGIEQLDVPRFSDSDRQILLLVRIESERVPGHSWEKGE